MTDSQDDHFYHQSMHISKFWKDKNFEYVERIGTKAISEGNWYPSVYQIMAMLYRKQKKYSEEAKVLKIGIQRNQKNPGAVKRDFAKRLDRVQQLIESSKRWWL